MCKKTWQTISGTLILSAFSVVYDISTHTPAVGARATGTRYDRLAA